MRLRKNYTGAQSMYERVLAVVPDHVPALCNYGNLLHNHLGDFDKVRVYMSISIMYIYIHTIDMGAYG